MRASPSGLCRRLFQRCAVSIFLLGLLATTLAHAGALRVVPPSAPAPPVRFFSVVLLEDQQLDFGKSPPVPAVFSHTPFPRTFRWFRELNQTLFPGPEYVDVSDLPATYFSDSNLWTFRSIPTRLPTRLAQVATTTIEFTAIAPGGRLPPRTARFVITNAGVTQASRNFLIEHFVDGVRISVQSGRGWATTLDTFQGIGIGRNPAALGTWAFLQRVNGVPTEDRFFVRTLGLRDTAVEPDPFDLRRGPVTVKATITGEPVGDAAQWTPEASTTWSATLKDFLTDAPLFTFSGTGLQIAQVFDGIVTPAALAGVPPHAGSHLAANQVLPPGDYPVDVVLVAQTTRARELVEEELTVGGNVRVTVTSTSLALGPSRFNRDNPPTCNATTLLCDNHTLDPPRIRPLVDTRPNNATLTVTVTDCNGTPVRDQRLQVVLSVPGDNPALGAARLDANGGHAHFRNRPLGIVKLLQTATGPVDAVQAPFLGITNRRLRGTDVSTTTEDNVFRYSRDRLMTNASGQAFVKFIAAPFGGDTRIKFIPLDVDGNEIALCANTQSDSVATLDVRVPGLELLPTDNDLYRKVGGRNDTTGTFLHPGPWLDPDRRGDERFQASSPGFPRVDVNHYGTNAFNQAISNLTRDFKNGYVDPRGRRVPGFPNEVVLINDMSLPRGGKFDIAGTWIMPLSTSPNRDGEHLFHRLGTSCDYNLESGNLVVNPNSQQARELRVILRRRSNLFFHEEGDHWHLYFEGGG